MKREFLEELGLDKEVIDKIMAEHGKSIQSLKQEQEVFDQLKDEKEQLEQQLQQLNDKLTAQEKELESVEDLKKENQTLKLNELKMNIARQANIPFELASRLNGSTEEEIKADAEKLAGFVNKKPTLPLKPSEPQDIDPKEEALKQMLKNITK